MALISIYTADRILDTGERLDLVAELIDVEHNMFAWCLENEHYGGNQSYLIFESNQTLHQYVVKHMPEFKFVLLIRVPNWNQNDYPVSLAGRNAIEIYDELFFIRKFNIRWNKSKIWQL